MNLTLLQEPELEFYGGSHIDTKFGLINHGPLDKDSPQCPKEIKIGVIGSNETSQSLGEWIDRISNGVEGKKNTSKYNLYPKFPGFGEGKKLNSKIILDESLTRYISQSDIASISKLSSYNDKINETVKILFENARHLTQNKNLDVLIFALPSELLKIINKDDSPHEPSKYDLHHLLKAKTMGLKKPCQLVLPPTHGLKANYSSRSLKQSLQEEATRAWNFYIALYYKAGGIPWRIKRVSTDLTTCFIGIGFYKTLDNNTVQTSVAQVFNERGEGIILRGGQAQFEKNNRRPYLSQEDSNKLIIDAIEMYKKEHKTSPARIVIHKSSMFREEEAHGFTSAIKEKGIEYFDLISITDSDSKLFRTKQYPPLRGTFLSLDSYNHILYTNGSIDFYQTYPGGYIPKPLLLRNYATDQSIKSIAEEILLLTKMNWNNTQFSNSQPITIDAARKVSDVLKYIETDSEIEARYSYYM